MRFHSFDWSGLRIATILALYLSWIAFKESLAVFFATLLLSLARYTSLTWPISTYFDCRSGWIAAACCVLKFNFLEAVSSRSAASFTMSALLYCPQTAGTVNKDIARMKLLRTIA